MYKMNRNGSRRLLTRRSVACWNWRLGAELEAGAHAVKFAEDSPMFVRLTGYQ